MHLFRGCIGFSDRNDSNADNGYVCVYGNWIILRVDTRLSIFFAPLFCIEHLFGANPFVHKKILSIINRFHTIVFMLRYYQSFSLCIRRFMYVYLLMPCISLKILDFTTLRLFKLHSNFRHIIKSFNNNLDPSYPNKLSVYKTIR